ncbi:transglutaminase-like domain-containing protein [Desulfoscipio sp. XC116]|uniref:transglutaminase-like domain-containing protein n=1 Tax=Desulfoscipio sp. XC116 TaxID=3144975 RepID=UPI00325AB659
MNIEPRGNAEAAGRSAGITLTFAENENTGTGKRAAPQLLLVLLLNAFGIMLTLSSAFQLPCHMGLTAGFVVVYALIGTAVFLLIPGRVPAVLSMAGLFCLICILGRAVLLEGLRQTLGWVGEVVAESGGSVPWFLKSVTVYETIPMTLFFTALLFPLIMLLSYAVAHRFNIFLLLLMIVPVLETTLFLGCLPSVGAFGLLILGASALFVLNQSVARPRKRCLDVRSTPSLSRQAGNLSLLTAALAGVLIAAAWLLVSETDYTAFANNSALRSQAGETIKRTLSFTYEEKTPPRGGITGGRFAETGRFSFKGETALVVEADALRGSIYLKGYVGGDYTADGWKPLPGKLADRGEKLASTLQVRALPSEVLSYDKAMLAKLFHAEQRLLKVTKSDAAPAQYQYVPYFLDAEAADKLGIGEQGIEAAGADKEESYSAAYYDVVNYDNNLFLLNRPEIKKQLGGNLGLAGGAVSPEQLDAYFGREEQYADFVRDAYTRLPDNLSRRLVDEFTALGSKAANVESLIKTVMGNLSGRAAYTLTPGNTPDRSDYVDYFLYENRKGYCTHFASAATVIFRLCGVPARYVEGYVITIEDYTRAARTEEGRYLMNIKDTNAHAWCEIYLDGFGWLPVEVTPGLVSVNTGGTAPTEGESIEYESEQESVSNDVPLEMPRIDEGPAEGGAAGGTGNETANGGSGKPPWGGIMIAAAALLLFLGILPFILRNQAVKRRIKELQNENRSQSGLSWYAYIMDALKVAAPQYLENRGISALAWAGQVEKEAVFASGTLLEVMPVIQKAAYAPNEISTAEHESLTRLLMKVAQQLYEGLPGFRKFKWRYIDRLPVHTEITGKVNSVE